jgi:hypothetical protein
MHVRRGLLKTPVSLRRASPPPTRSLVLKKNRGIFLHIFGNNAEKLTTTSSQFAGRKKSKNPVILCYTPSSEPFRIYKNLPVDTLISVILEMSRIALVATGVRASHKGRLKGQEILPPATSLRSI